jgi:hypothetical protein
MFFIKKILLLIALCFFFSQPSQASSILEVDFQQIVNRAESIFEGEVVATSSEMSADGNIYTLVDFLVLDVLSGNLNVGESITLRFTGGTVNGLTLSVGSVIPAIGEHGVYFIEAINAQLINPLYGWSQGHYRIQANGHIIAGDSQVVIGSDKNSRDTSSNIKLSTGIAKGIITLPQQHINTPPLAPPILLDEFKLLINDTKK